MMIDRILHEKYLGFQWKPFACKKSSKQSQLQSIQSFMDARQSQCIDGQSHMNSSSLDEYLSHKAIVMRYNNASIVQSLNEFLSTFAVFLWQKWTKLYVLTVQNAISLLSLSIQLEHCSRICFNILLVSEICHCRSGREGSYALQNIN